MLGVSSQHSVVPVPAVAFLLASFFSCLPIVSREATVIAAALSPLFTVSPCVSVPQGKVQLTLYHEMARRRLAGLLPVTRQPAVCVQSVEAGAPVRCLLAGIEWRQSLVGEQSRRAETWSRMEVGPGGRVRQGVKEFNVGGGG